MSDHHLPVALPSDIVDRIIELVRHAGAIARRSYSEHDKWDTTAFGAVLWRLTWNHVEEGLRDAGVPTWKEENSLRFQIAGFTCSLYSGGHDVGWDVHRYDFARTAKREETANPAQGRLFDLRTIDLTSVPDPELLKSITFVYSGHPLFGCVAVHVGAPIKEGAQFRWGWVECLYRFEDSGPAPYGKNVPVFPSFADQPEVDLAIGMIDQPNHRDGAAGTAG